ncbi:MAG: carboxymuconolactone decarboxylase family protein, partial [Gammaproteobacteria bacterium]
MQARMDYKTIAPDAVKAMRGLEVYLHRCGLESSLLELV